MQKTGRMDAYACGKADCEVKFVAQLQPNCLYSVSSGTMGNQVPATMFDVGRSHEPDRPGYCQNLLLLAASSQSQLDPNSKYRGRLCS